MIICLFSLVSLFQTSWWCMILLIPFLFVCVRVSRGVCVGVQLCLLIPSVLRCNSVSPGEFVLVYSCVS